MKESFIFYETWAEAIRQLPDKERLQVFDAIMAYGIYNLKTEIGGLAQMALNLIYNDIDDCKQKRKEKTEKARDSAYKRWQKDEANECERIQTHTNGCKRIQTDATQCYNVNVNVNDNVNVDVNGDNGVFAEKSAKNQKAPKKKYGEFDNVLLTDEEAQKLHNEFGNDAVGIVEFLSAYRAEKGYKNKSDYLSIKRWVAKAYYEHLNQNQNGNNNGTGNRSIQERAERIAEYAFAANGVQNG